MCLCHPCAHISFPFFTLSVVVDVVVDFLLFFPPSLLSARSLLSHLVAVRDESERENEQQSEGKDAVMLENLK